MVITGLVILACGLAALAYLVLRRMRVDEERDRQETRMLRDLPPPPGSAGVHIEPYIGGRLARLFHG